MLRCDYWKLESDNTRGHWVETVTQTCTQWADEGSQQCSSWADEGSQQCSSWADEGSKSCCDWAPCSWFCAAVYWIAKWVCIAWYWVAKWVCVAWYWIAKWVCVGFATVVNWIWIAAIYLVWVACKIVSPGKGQPTLGRIKHVFVVMLENRSFDHMLGLSQLEGFDSISGNPTTIEGLNATNNTNLDANAQAVTTSTPADWAMPFDPGHEFANVKEQLCGKGGDYPNINNSGFVINYEKLDQANRSEIMKCSSSEQLPVLTSLARNFAVCDHWFSSIPGPTWPNRFFIHAASSGGLDDSPSGATSFGAILFDGYEFDNGTI